MSSSYDKPPNCRAAPFPIDDRKTSEWLTGKTVRSKKHAAQRLKGNFCRGSRRISLSGKPVYARSEAARTAVRTMLTERSRLARNSSSG